MDAPHRAIKSLLGKVHLYRPAKAAYKAFFGKEARKRNEQLSLFYSQFVRADDLVFDIGANVGQYSDVFSSLGATVVAVEPNPDCARRIRMSCSRSLVHVVEAAVGAHEGTGALKTARQSVLSSMSDEWLDVARRAQRFEGISWDNHIDVRVVTIDSLIRNFGHPRFIKIDVEGYEELVLKGMSKQPEVMSFEFNTEFLDLAFRCIDSPSISPLSQFSYLLGEPKQLELSTYVTAAEIKAHLGALERLKTFGDVIVRLAATPSSVGNLAKL